MARPRLLSLLALVSGAVALALWYHTNRDRPAMSQSSRPATAPTTLRIEIRKSDRRLLVARGPQILREYRIGLGFAPTGDKEREGDGRTPEGDYVVCARNPQSRYHLSLGLSYPNAADAARGLVAGAISQAQHDAILSALAKGGRPPWDTPLGGEIFIHGNGSHRDWTLGCIALDDADMDELYALTPVGTPVRIRR
jgi:murein L,D-transpeptidase YafK